MCVVEKLILYSKEGIVEFILYVLLSFVLYAFCSILNGVYHLRLSLCEEHVCLTLSNRFCNIIIDFSNQCVCVCVCMFASENNMDDDLVFHVSSFHCDGKFKCIIGFLSLIVCFTW